MSRLWLVLTTQTQIVKHYPRETASQAQEPASQVPCHSGFGSGESEPHLRLAPSPAAPDGCSQTEVFQQHSIAVIWSLELLSSGTWASQKQCLDLKTHAQVTFADCKHVSRRAQGCLFCCDDRGERCLFSHSPPPFFLVSFLLKIYSLHLDGSGLCFSKLTLNDPSPNPSIVLWVVCVCIHIHTYRDASTLLYNSAFCSLY